MIGLMNVNKFKVNSNHESDDNDTVIIVIFSICSEILIPINFLGVAHCVCGKIMSSSLYYTDEQCFN
jgi:hypothetical protein